MKIRDVPGELAGSNEVPEVLDQRDKELVYCADETVLCRGSDVDGVIGGRAVAGAFDPDPVESHAHGDRCKTRPTDRARHAQSSSRFDLRG